jgi:CBS domain-containing protein
MTTEVHSIESTRPIAEAARIMADRDIGALPVLENGTLVGMVTDRDIAVRAVAPGITAGGRVADIMSAVVQSCHPAETLDQALDEMAAQKIRSMPVLSSDGALVGIITLGDIVSVEDDFRTIGRTLRDISTPHGRHSQTAEAI